MAPKVSKNDVNILNSTFTKLQNWEAFSVLLAKSKNYKRYRKHDLFKILGHKSRFSDKNKVEFMPNMSKLP